MKVKAILTQFWGWFFTKKNFLWLLPVIIFAVWYFFVPRHWYSFVAGAILMAGIWWVWTHIIKKDILPKI